MTLPPGFRFHPTDEELVAYYLHRKINGETIELELIQEVDLYKCEPWDLPDKSLLPSKDMEWYFYSPRDRKYPNGSRTNRATMAGYWKATGKDRAVLSAKRPVGMKKTLVYYRGRAPHGIRTDWVMHEYRLMHQSQSPTDQSCLEDSYALCRVFKKNVCNPTTKGAIGEGCTSFDQLFENISPITSTEISREDLIDDENVVQNQEPISKFPSAASSSNVTEGMITTTTLAFDDQNLPPHCTNLDHEVNSTTYMDQFRMPSFVLDVRIDPSYNEGQIYDEVVPPCPPLALEDFPQMDATLCTSKSNNEHMNWERLRESCLNGIMLEEIYSICSSRDNYFKYY